MYLYVEHIRDVFGLCAIQISFLLTYLLTISMHYGDSVWNWIVQINFRLKPKFGINFGLALVLAEASGFKLGLKLDFIVTLLFALIRF